MREECLRVRLNRVNLFIINELIYRGISINSLAPKFIGEFQKAIDYVGDVHEFEKNFKIH